MVAAAAAGTPDGFGEEGVLAFVIAIHEATDVQDRQLANKVS